MAVAEAPAVDRVQPAVHLRRGRSGQDPPADRRRAPHAPAQPGDPREVRDLRAVRDRVHQVGARAPGRLVPSALPRGGRPARRRHPVPRQARGDADRVLPHVQPPARRHETDRDRLGPPAARALRARGAAREPVPVGAVRRRPAARPGDADRDPAAEGRARAPDRAARRDRVRGVEVRPVGPRARGCPRAGRRLVRAHRPADRPGARRAGAAGPDPAARTRDPAAADHGGDRAATSRCRPATSHRSPARARSRRRVTSRCT